MLTEFLLAHRATILARTESNVAAGGAPLPPQEEQAEQEELLLLGHVVDALGSAPGPPGGLETSAARHGGDALRKRFTVARLVHAYGSLRLAVAEVAAEARAPIAADEWRRFNRSLDDAIALGVTEYERQREQSLADEVRVGRGEHAHELRNALGSAMISFDVLRTGSVGFSGSTASVLSVSLRRMAMLVESSLANVRLEAGLRSPERVSVREFIEEVEVGASAEATPGRRSC